MRHVKGGTEAKVESTGETEIRCEACRRLVAVVGAGGVVEVSTARAENRAWATVDLHEGTVSIDCPGLVGDAMAGRRRCGGLVVITREDADRLTNW